MALLHTVMSAVRTKGSCVVGGALVVLPTPQAFCSENFPMAGAGVKLSNQFQGGLS